MTRKVSSMSLPERSRTYSESLRIAEDRGLFRGPLVNILVELTPERRKSSRGDMVLRAYVAGKPIEVVFTGRRHAAAVPLLHRLQALLQTVEPDGPRPRLKVAIDGIWRIRMAAERDGISDRRFQLVAARWHFAGRDGIKHLHGELPVT